MMWQEARKQERKIRGMLVDYKRRAERRKDYYEKIKADPTQFIQIHGRPCKIHLDSAVAIAGDSPANMMSWQGNQDIMIDRFDVRAHLDYIPEVTLKKQDEDEITSDDRQINYERYRILAQNDFLGVSEEKFLQQLSVEEQFGPVEKPEPQPIEGKKKVVGATIGYNYNEETSSPSTGPVTAAVEEAASSEDDDDDDDDDSDIDFDLCVDVNKISSSQAHEMNAAAVAYGMVSNDFFSFLTRDVEEAETLKMAREREEEKAMFSGRKSRRERRAFREKKLFGRKISPPSYAASKDAPIVDLIRNVTKSHSRSRSRSASPPNAGMIQYITSFGGEEPPLEPPPQQSIKTSVHSSRKEDNAYKRTVRYRSSRTPESNIRRQKFKSGERSVRYRSRSREKVGPENSRRSRSPRRRSKSPSLRRVHYQSRSPSRSPIQGTYSKRIKCSRKRQSYSRSKSPSPVIRVVKKSTSPAPVRSIEIPAPPVITRYYGRHKTQSSSSELDLSDTEDKKDQTSDKVSAPDKSNHAVGNSGGRSKPAVSASKISLQERLKKKRQALINRQYKADKRAERLRQEKAEQERLDREDEMREMSIKMRRRERQKRHQYYELDESNAAENSDDGRLSTVTSESGSDNPASDTELRSKNHSEKSKESEKESSSQETDKSKYKDSRKDDTKRDRELSVDKEKRSQKYKEDQSKAKEEDKSRGKEDLSRGKDDERPHGRDRSRDQTRDRSKSREKERYRRVRERSRDRIRSRDRERFRDRERSRDWQRDRSRERDRYSNRHSMELDSTMADVKKPIRPLVDY